MRLYKCWFCGSTVYPGHGIAFVRNDAKVFRFCRSKCHKNFKMKRNPRKLRWTKAFRQVAAKEMSMDSVLDIEKKHNRPVKYDRNLMSTTVKVMKRVAEIRQKRSERFYEQRMKGNKQKETEEARKELEQGRSLIPTPLKDKVKKKSIPIKAQATSITTMMDLSK